jgi:hypothetical protein
MNAAVASWIDGAGGALALHVAAEAKTPVAGLILVVAFRELLDIRLSKR